MLSGAPDYSRVVPCSCARQELDHTRLARLQLYSNLGPLVRYTFDNLVTGGRSGDAANQERYLRAFNAARTFAEQPQGWLVLMGPSGCGKTHLAAAIINHRLEHGLLALYQSVSDLLDHLRATFSPNSDLDYDDLFEQVRNAPLLVLDDLGKYTGSAWAQEKLTQVLDHRSLEHLPTVVNIAAGVLLEDLDDRWQTRLMSPVLSQVHLLEESAPSLLDSSGLAGFELLSTMTFESFDPKRANLPPEQRENLEGAFRLARSFAETPDGWLTFQGDIGCGKTHLAASIANHRIRSGKPVRFEVVPDLLDRLRAGYSPDSRAAYDDVFERVKMAPLLVLDDLGEHSSTPWAQEKLYQLVNYRYNARLPMVITMRCSLDDEGIESRIASRLADHRIGTVFNIMAPDYRVDRNSRNTGNNGPRRGRRRSSS